MTIADYVEVLPPSEAAMVDVEIVVPVYNEEADLASSVVRLHEFLRRDFPFSAVITIADNASTDGTWGIARTLADELPSVACRTPRLQRARPRPARRMGVQHRPRGGLPGR
jgi:glycosyltransferase involved in cell wall biosynthesis